MKCHVWEIDDDEKMTMMYAHESNVELIHPFVSMRNIDGDDDDDDDDDAADRTC
jgi:hypothetical protein